jgi:hypothetical protein
MPATLETKSRKLTSKANLGSKKRSVRVAASKANKAGILKKPFAYLIGCIEGAPDLSKRKGYSTK